MSQRVHSVTSSITLCTVENGYTYRIGCSPSSVTIPSDATTITFGLVLDFHKKEAEYAEENYSCYWAIFRKKKDGTYARLNYGGKATSVPSQSITADMDTDSFLVRIGDSSITTSGSAYVYEAVIMVTKDGDTGAAGYNQATISLYKRIASTPSKPTAALTYNFATQALTPTSALNGWDVVIPASNGNPCWIIQVQKSSRAATVEIAVADWSTPVILVQDGTQGAQGKMSRNIYFAGFVPGEQGHSFQATDYSAPYVQVTYNDVTKYFVYIGSNGTKTFPAASTMDGGSSGYSDTSQWKEIVTEFDYMMTKAFFTEYANLGSAVFNKDFMFSQYGSLKGYGKIEKPISNNNWFRFANASNMSGEVSSALHESAIETAVSNTSFNTETSRFHLSLQTGKYYWLKIRCNAGENRGVEFKITTLGGSEDVLQQTITDGEEHLYGPISVPANGTYYLYYRRTGTVTTNPTIKYSMMSDVTFCPNIYADWLKGFFYAQYGMFKNVVVEGVFNNLITEIDWDNNINRDLIIPYTFSWNSNTLTRYCLDVLRCGNIVRIKSLPSELHTGGTSSNPVEKRLHLPYYIQDDNVVGTYQMWNSRTYTKLGKDGTVLSTARLITADEMRMLVGRKLVLILDVDLDWANSYITSHKAVPSGIAGTSSIELNQQAIIDVANGQPHVDDATSSSCLMFNDVAMTGKKSVYMECRLVRDIRSDRYCYIWTNTTADATNGNGEPIDDSWT